MEPSATIQRVKGMHFMEVTPGKSVTIGYGFTGLILELEDGRIMKHCSSDAMQQFNEITPSNSNYEQVKALITYKD